MPSTIRQNDETAAKMLVKFQVNGARHEVAVRPAETLLHTLREVLLLTGTKNGCDMGTCGCCTVILDGKPILSCLTLTAEIDGKSIETIEGVRDGEGLHPVQRAFAECGGSQCGFCTPGFIMSSVANLRSNPTPSRDQIRQFLSGNMCRCTGYLKILDAVEHAACEIRGERKS